MRLGILAPYNLSEATAMAIRLAAVAAREGWDVTWAATRRAAPVHPAWDRRVRSVASIDRHGGLPAWAAAHDLCVWFETDPGGVAKVMATRKGPAGHTRHALVPPWHSTTTLDLQRARSFDVIVCPNREMADRMTEAVNDSAFVSPLVCPWVTGLTKFRRDAVNHSALVWVDRYTWRHFGASLSRCITTWPEVATKTRFTLVIDGRPDQSESRTLRRALGTGRLVTVERPTFPALLTAVCGHDWLILPGPRHSCGLLAAQARALGAPAIAWDVCPMRGQIDNHHDGVLIPCNTLHTIGGAETALFNTPALTEAVLTTLPDDDLLLKLREGCYGRQEWWPASFAAFWSGILLETRAA